MHRTPRTLHVAVGTLLLALGGCDKNKPTTEVPERTNVGRDDGTAPEPEAEHSNIGPETDPEHTNVGPEADPGDEAAADADAGEGP